MTPDAAAGPTQADSRHALADSCDIDEHIHRTSHIKDDSLLVDTLADITLIHTYIHEKSLLHLFFHILQLILTEGIRPAAAKA